MPVNLAQLPQKIIINNEELILKTSFHISLLCTKNILEKFKLENLEEKIIQLFCEFTSNNEITFLRFTKEFRRAEFDDRKSVVVRCEISNLSKAIEFISSKLKIDIPDQPAHITLYTLQQDMGIGLNSEMEMQKKSILIGISPEVTNSLAIL